MDLNNAPTTSQGGDESSQKRRRYTEEVLCSWNLIKIYHELGTREQGIAFAEKEGLIRASKTCSRHRVPMKIDLSANNTVGHFFCSKKSCYGKTRVSRTKGTWFENVKLKLNHIFYLMYCCSKRWTHDEIINEDPWREVNKQCISRATITDWYSYCRETVVLYQMKQEQDQGKIGGPGKVVQIDESKFGKRKYNKGRRVEGHWVLGFIEDGSEDLRLEVCPDNIRSAEVLIPLIQKHVHEGTTIHTDFWKAYDCLDQYGYIHKKVNHSDPDKPFVAEDGTHTRRIESQWRVLKRYFYKENFNYTENLGDILFEFMWRRTLEKNKRDSFKELIKAIQFVYGVE